MGSQKGHNFIWPLHDLFNIFRQIKSSLTFLRPFLSFLTFLGPFLSCPSYLTSTWPFFASWPFHDPFFARKFSYDPAVTFVSVPAGLYSGALHVILIGWPGVFYDSSTLHANKIYTCTYVDIMRFGLWVKELKRMIVNGRACTKYRMRRNCLEL